MNICYPYGSKFYIWQTPLGPLRGWHFGNSSRRRHNKMTRERRVGGNKEREVGLRALGSLAVLDGGGAVGASQWEGH